MNDGKLIVFIPNILAGIISMFAAIIVLRIIHPILNVIETNWAPTGIKLAMFNLIIWLILFFVFYMFIWKVVFDKGQESVKNA